MSQLKKQILSNVTSASKRKIVNVSKDYVTPYSQEHIDSLTKEIHFLREELMEKSQMIKTSINRAEQNTHEQNIFQTHDNKYDAKTVDNKRTPDELVLTYNEPITDIKAILNITYR